MRRLVLVSLWVGLLLAAALHCGWTDLFHLGVGTVLLMFPGALALWIRRHHASDEVASDEEISSHPARSLLIHGLSAALCVGYLTASFHLLHAAGFGMSELDQDRTAFEERLQIFEEAHQYDRAAEMIEERLNQVVSETWGRMLGERLYRALINAGKNTKELQSRHDKFTRASEVARKYQLDATLALRLDEECQLEGEYLNRLKKLRGEKAWRTLANVLEGGLAEDAPGKRHLPISTWLRDCLLDWSHELKVGNDRKEKLSRAMEVCVKYRLDDHAVRLAIELFGKELRPAALPVGAKGGVICVVRDYFPPALIADVWLDTANGRPIEKLHEKDFQIYCDGKPVADFIVHEESRDLVPMHFILAIDTSGSMAGPAIAAAESGSNTLVRGLHPLGQFHDQMWVKLLTFHSEISVRSQWTKDMLGASATLKGLKADGGTALFKTVMYSIQEFKGRTGHKHLLLFTDGKDTDGGPDVGSLVAMCKKEGVVISTIGLRSDDLDVATLRRLASETGGTYAEADGPQQLLEQFRQAGARVRPHFYRLVLHPKGGTPGGLEFRVGGENSVLLKGP